MTLALVFALAATFSGVVQTSYVFAGLGKYLRLADCHLTDDYVISSFGGSLAPGQSFSTYLDLCYPDQYSMLYGVDEETDEDFAFDLAARGDLTVGLVLIRRDFPDRNLAVSETPGKPLDSWIGCAYPSYWMTYTADGMGHLGGARILVTLANTTRHTIRDIALNLYLSLQSATFQAFHGC